MPRSVTGRRRILVAVVAAVAAALTHAMPAMAEEAPPNTVDAPFPTVVPDAETRAAARDRAASLAAELDLSTASLDDVDAAIMALDRDLRTAQAAMRSTDRRLAALQERARRLERSIRSLDAEVRGLREEIRRQAVDAFVRPPADDVGESVLSGDFLAASQQRFLLGLVDGADGDAAEVLAARRRELDHQRVRLRETLAQTRRTRARQQAQLADVQAAQLQQQALATSIRATIVDQIHQSIELVALDPTLAVDIARRQAALQARLTSWAEASDAPVDDVQSPEGGELVPLPPGGAPSLDALGLSLCTVEGITVNCLIGFDLALMVRAARADGVALTGAGYRDPAQQIALRRAHCGTSYEAVFLAPAGSCTPATARPGSSLHEIGLAVDFAPARSASSPAYRWLVDHAATYGFRNLPGEPWHWSVTGG